LNFYQKNKRADRIRVRAAALEEAETQHKRTAEDKKLQIAIAREEEVRETAEKKIRKEAEHIAAREKVARDKAARTAEKDKESTESARSKAA
jgi:hypothetical protein